MAVKGRTRKPRKPLLDKARKPRLRQPHTNRSQSEWQNAKLEIRIFEAIANHAISSVSQLAAVMGMEEEEQVIQRRVNWLAKHGWIINRRPGQVWAIGCGGDSNES